MTIRVTEVLNKGTYDRFLKLQPLQCPWSHIIKIQVLGNLLALMTTVVLHLLLPPCLPTIYALFASWTLQPPTASKTGGVERRTKHSGSGMGGGRPKPSGKVVEQEKGSSQWGSWPMAGFCMPAGTEPPRAFLTPRQQGSWDLILKQCNHLINSPLPWDPQACCFLRDLWKDVKEGLFHFGGEGWWCSTGQLPWRKNLVSSFLQDCLFYPTRSTIWNL